MAYLSRNVIVKQWLLFVMILMSGYATGAACAKLANAIGL